MLSLERVVAVSASITVVLTLLSGVGVPLSTVFIWGSPPHPGVDATKKANPSQRMCAPYE